MDRAWGGPDWKNNTINGINAGTGDGKGKEKKKKAEIGNETADQYCEVI